MNQTDTIAAIATAPGRGAIGIIRLSGPGAIAAVEGVFRPAGGAPLSRRPPRSLVLGPGTAGAGRGLDSALATFSPGPGSYTGEDTAELHCHGSPVVLGLVLEALFAQGARQAGPGEFTRRAFLNGKLDLAQSEAVIDLIDAETPAAAHQAAGQLTGALSRRVEEIYRALVDLMAHFHAVLDYPDEDIDPLGAAEMESALALAAGNIRRLLSTYRRGQMLSQGLPCAIVGRPNAGKSSLLNALLGYDRAIVTPIAGTTRDTIEERLTLGGVLLRLIDTAGMRESQDQVEQLGVERSRAAARRASLVLAVVDGSRPLEEEDQEALALAAAAPMCIVVRNKTDLPLCPQDFSPLPPGTPVVEVSSLTGEGLDQLELAIEELIPQEGEGEAGALLTNARQADAARRAGECVERAQAALAAGVTPDAVLTDVEEALSALGELTGRSVREDVVSTIFRRFCVGK